MKTYIVMIFYHQSHICKILARELLSKTILANQLAGFFKIVYLEKEVNDVFLFLAFR